MIQLLFDLFMVIVTGGLLLKASGLAKKVSALQTRQTAGLPSDEELAHVRRLEIAAGIREPDSDPPKPLNTHPIKCPCGHLINMHRQRSGGRCTVAMGRLMDTVCACEWGQADIVDWAKGEGMWRR